LPALVRIIRKSGVNPPWRILITSTASFLLVYHTPAGAPKVTYTPQQPKSGEPVRVTARFKEKAGTVVLEYQLVDPGNYIGLTDTAFKTNWASLPMTAEKPRADANGAGNVLTTELPARLQTHRRLVRYRLVADGKVIAPGPDAAVPNFAYFVYDGVPAWRGAVDPQSSHPKKRQPITFGTNVMRSLPVYQFISKKTSIENTTWFNQPPFGDEAARKKYNFTGTFVADDGKVYDHVGFRARGGEWRYAMGKHMWKFDFNRGAHLQARDDFGQPYKTKWEKLNLGACIQQGDYGMRGEQGMFEALAFRLFNLVGVEAPRTHWVHLRIIDGAEENPASQYEGDFWGLYLATENVDDAFLKEHELPSGNLYKLEFGRPDVHSKSGYATAGNEDVRQFMSACRKSQDESWWRSNADLPRYFSYRSMVECIHHYDIGSGKNYFFYHNPQTGRWSMLPWDVDLTWGDHMYGTSAEPFYRAGVLSQPSFRIEYENRLCEILDLLYNPEQMDALLEEHAAIISDPKGGPSFVDADRAKWDFHPIMASRFVHGGKAGQGRFYESSATRDFRGMVQLMKNYVRTRGKWIENTLLRGGPLPPTPSVTNEGRFTFGASVPDSNSELKLEWRLAEATPRTTPGPGRQYEVAALWQTNGPSRMELPAKLIKSGHTYRVRARVQESSGRCGHWSAPVEFAGRN
jgi:hypothetical protein